MTKEIVPDDSAEKEAIGKTIVEGKKEDVFGAMTRNQIELIKRTIAKDATDDELRMFLQVCKGAQLNPFLKHVFLVKRWDNREERNIATVQVGIDGFRSIAESSGNYAGNDDPEYSGEKKITVNKRDITVPGKATVSVSKLLNGNICKFTASARWEEYYPGEKMGFQWHNRPFLMLGKCAEALALRKAFPKLLSGMYEEAELGMSSEKASDAPAINHEPEKILGALENAINSATKDELIKYREKINTPGKKSYTDEQKASLLKLIEQRLSLDDIPVIDAETGEVVK